jgi:hypothetical protein
MTQTLQDNFDFYISHQAALVEKYNGRFIVIKDCEVKSDHNSYLDAFLSGTSMFGAGNFIIQLCTPGAESYTQTFHSRVKFA